MSKSKQNYTDPMQLINAQGADALRLYLMGSPVMNAENLAFSDTDVAKLRQRVLNMWWNVVSFYRMYQPSGFVASREVPHSDHALDRWILARTESTVQSITANLDTYNLTTATRQLIELVDDISTWYLRLSRDQLRAGDAATWQTFAWVLHRLSLLGAPIVPFISEATYQVGQPESDSVHLVAWPTTETSLLNTELLSEMSLARKVVEAGHAQRKAAALKVRQPLASATVTAQPLSEAVSALIATELNVKAVNWTNGEELTVTLDTTLTPQLEAEGQAREFIRSVQQLRRDSGTALDAWINLTAPSWPAEFEDMIKEKAKISSLSIGDTLTIVE